MTRYYQRPIVEAVQWTGDNYEQVLALAADRYNSLSHDGTAHTIEIWTDRRSWYARAGDWIVRTAETVRVYSDAAFREQHEPTPAVVPAGQHETEDGS